MVDYIRMGRSEPQMGTATSTTSLHWMRDLWKSPRGTVLRIEFLALAAIALSFLVVAFGSCRRWSNRWIIQKGFFAASALSLSLGTYSIGLMQSSSVKSEMYPIWAVSLFTLLPCIDPITSYTGLNYKSPLSKMVSQMCLYFGYVLLMGISSTSSGIGNKAIFILSAITFIKGFHMSLAFVLPSRLRDMVGSLRDDVESQYLNRRPEYLDRLIVDFPPALDASKFAVERKIVNEEVAMLDILKWSCQQRSEERKIVGTSIPVLEELSVQSDDSYQCMVDILQPSREERSEKRDTVDYSKEKKDNDEQSSIVNVSLAFALSHLLQRHFLGLSDNKSQSIFHLYDCVIDHRWALKLIEVELAFLYETFFTSNAFLHYYQAKTASIWTFISFIAICFVGVAVAIPGTRTTRHHRTPGPSVGTSIVVETTTTDLVVTLVILVSLALLQLLLLIRCWTSNWARVAFVCQKTRDHEMGTERPMWWWRLKRFTVTRINWFDKYLWQDKLGQYSIVEESRKGQCKDLRSNNGDKNKALSIRLRYAYQQCARLCRMLGLQYIMQVLRELFGGKYKGVSSVRLHTHVKASIEEFLGQIKNDKVGEIWYSSFDAVGVARHDVAYYSVVTKRQTVCFLEWHIATCYCELAELGQEDSPGNAACFLIPKAHVASGGGETDSKYRHVAIALSKYYAYLVVSAPELLPGRSWETKQVYDKIAWYARWFLGGKTRAKDQLEAMEKLAAGFERPSDRFVDGIRRGRQLCGKDHWKVLADFWVRALVFVAPYGNKEEHMQHLSQGGEFITHLWALLYHLDTYEWKQPTRQEKMYRTTRSFDEESGSETLERMDRALSSDEERGSAKSEEVDVALPSDEERIAKSEEIEEIEIVTEEGGSDC